MYILVLVFLFFWLPSVAFFLWFIASCCREEQSILLIFVFLSFHLLISVFFSESMSNCNDVAPEQLCYIPCNFCNIVLAVSVPSSSLFDIVTVRCGHCTNLWSVNMAAALQSLSWQQVQTPNYARQDYRTADFGSSSKTSKLPTQSLVNNVVSKEKERIVNRPSGKRQRVASAYNQFIKEEIQRIKANNPDISHREAFSTAAKNWAHFPQIHFGLMLETNNQNYAG